MPHISISSPPGNNNPQLVAAIRSITGAKVSEISAALKAGTPLFDGELFARPRKESVMKIQNLLSVLREAQITPVVTEGGRLISTEILLNIIRASERSMSEFDQLGSQAHEA